MIRNTMIALAALAVLALAGPARAADAANGDAQAVALMKDAHLNLYYPGNDFKAVVHMELKDKKGKTRTREFVMMRLDLVEGGQQKYYTYFLEPGDVRRTSFMVWKDPDKDDSRWIYIPAIDLVRQISSSDKGSSFVGSDFSYEDVSGRHWTEDTHKILRQEALNGRPATVVESIPLEKDEFARKLTWVDDATHLAQREEYYDDKGELTRVYEALEVKEIDGHPTVTKRKMTNVKKEHETIVDFNDVHYDVGLTDDLFTERYLKAPPSQYISF
jgi:outer membrane lipoprotein-sorting protein